MKLTASLAGAAALLTLGACDRLSPSGQSAANDKGRAQPAARQNGPNAVRVSANNGLPTGNGAPNGQGLANNPNAIATSATLTPTVDRAFLIGRWTDARDCEQAGEFTADGRYTNTSGQNATWTLEGDRLTLAFGSVETRTVQVSALDQNTLEVTNPNGSKGRSTRC